MADEALASRLKFGDGLGVCGSLLVEWEIKSPWNHLDQFLHRLFPGIPLGRQAKTPWASGVSREKKPPGAAFTAQDAG